MLNPNDSGACARDVRINAYLRAVAPQGRAAIRCGPFLATFDTRSDTPFRNYAVPDDRAVPTAPEIEAFARLCAAYGRYPRLEYAPGAAPGLEAALVRAGFSVEMRPPMMTCGAGQVRACPPPEGFTVADGSGPDALAAAVAVQTAAYAEHGLSGDGDPQPLASSIAAGGALFLATEDRTGAAAGAGQFTPPHAGVAEVAGIGVAPLFRRRGLASALTSAIAAEAFRRGVELAFLTPGGTAAQRAYERAGFVCDGEMVMISRP